MKYIIVRNQFGDETAILFDEILDHAKVAHSFGTAISAGFCYVKGVLDKWDGIESETHCYGQSTTLQLKSRDEDLSLIQKALRNRL